MIELLALPGWRTTPTTLDAWVAQLESQAGPVVVTRESTSAVWLEIGPLRLRGYAMVAGQTVEAINFELAAPDLEPATRAVETAALALGWEVNLDDDEEGDDDDDEHDEAT
jgi:hypothetical protein